MFYSLIKLDVKPVLRLRKLPFSLLLDYIQVCFIYVYKNYNLLIIYLCFIDYMDPGYV